MHPNIQMHKYINITIIILGKQIIFEKIVTLD